MCGFLENKILLVCSNKNDVQRSSIALYSISFFQKNPFHGFFTSFSRFSSLRKKNLRKNFFLRENWIKNSDENTKNEKFANKTSHGKSRILYKGKINQNPMNYFFSESTYRIPIEKKKLENTRKIHQMVLLSLEVRIYLHADLENSCYSKNHYFYSSQWNSCCCGHC